MLMRVLHVTFRYGRDVYGGAEYYLRKLTEELSKRDLDIDICTTATHKLTPVIRSGVLWDNILADESINGEEILRFQCKNPNRYLCLVFEKLIQSQWDKEESSSMNYLVDTFMRLYEQNNGVFLSGWNPPERYGTFEMKWTKNNAKILINDANIEKVSFSVMNRKRINSILHVKSENYETSIRLPKLDDWSTIDINLPSITGKVLIDFELDRVWKPLKDHRSLGIAVASVKYRTDNYERTLDMENDYKKFLLSKGLYIDYLRSNAVKRPKFYSGLFDYLRGPNSNGMIGWLDKNKGNYEIVMAQMFPFNTIKYAFKAKKRGTPVALLPLMHVDDEFYHWRHYYDLLKQADVVFALSEYSKTQLFDKIGANSVFVGAGIDRDIFLSNEVDGDKFRAKHGLNDENIILTVSRKSGSKRYDLLIKAVEKVKKKIRNARLVMIGPDEDGLPVNSDQMTYLGKVSQEDLVNAYDACDVFAMMSESESFGMVFCEAWSRKKPVIGNIYCGAVASLIDNGIDGFLCKDVEEIADRIEWLLDKNDLAKKLGEKGFRKVVDNYTWEKVADKVYRTYIEIDR